MAAQIERAHQAAVADALGVHREARPVHPDGPQRGPAGRRPRAGGGRVHPPRLPRRRPGPAHPRRGREQGADPRRALAVASTAGCCSRPTSPPPRPTTPPWRSTSATRLGVRFAERPGTDPGKRPVREIVGVDPALNQRWSTRRAAIETRRGELATQFQADHGRPPTPVEAMQLAQQATLETRDAKHEPRTLAEQRAAWRTQAAGVLGGRRRRRGHGARRPCTPPPSRRPWPMPRGCRRRPTGSWRRWRTRARPGRSGTSAPRRTARSAPPTCPPSRSTRWSTCSSTRCWTPVGPPLPAARRHRRTGRAAARRRRQRLHRRRRRPVHLAADPGRRAAARRHRRPPRRAHVVDSAVELALLERPPTAPPSTPGRPRWSARWPPPAPGCSWRSRPPAPARPPPCAPSPGLDRGRRPRASGSPRPRPQPPSARADRHPHRHPGQAHLVHRSRRPAGLGGQRSARRPWW